MKMNKGKYDYKLKFQEAERIILGIIESAYLNARDINEQEAKEIDQASKIYFEKVDSLLEGVKKSYILLEGVKK